MAAKFLYDTIVEEFGRRTLQNTEIPDYLKDNLNPKFELRPYQEEAFARFFLCFEEDFDGKENPLHLLFNMATGSGKTLIMAGLILYLYEKVIETFSSSSTLPTSSKRQRTISSILCPLNTFSMKLFISARFALP